MVSYTEAGEAGSKTYTLVLCVHNEYGNSNFEASGVAILKLDDYCYQSKVCVPAA